jgi:hypothetical protein
MTMRMNNIKAILKAATLAAAALLLTASASFAQQVVNLTAAPTSTILPDGTTVQMWGYTCAPVTGTAAATGPQTCVALNPLAPAAAPWSPVVITVPAGQDLTISLTNGLSFLNGNTVPTSLVIVGQLGGGLGTTATSTASPAHPGQGVTWPIAGAPDTSGQVGGDPTSLGNPTSTPPAQGSRVQSFSTEVAAGATTSLCWGITCAVPTPALRPGTYLIESGTHPSIQGPMGLYGMLVVTTAPAGAVAGTAYGTAGTATAVSYNAEVPLLLSEIDSVQNNAVSTAVNTAGFSETKVWSGQPGQCGNPGSAVGVINTCYPPAVNYTPLYYLFNGAAFNKTSAGTSLFAAFPGTAAAPASGTVLVRFVNAGLRMHVPSIVGSQTGTASGFSLIAEDGNPLPGVARRQDLRCDDQYARRWRNSAAGV